MEDALQTTWQEQDALLLDAARDGSIDAFGELVDRYHDRVRRYLIRLTGDAEIARDLAQDTFLDAFRSIADAPEDRSFRIWLFVIARNNYLTYQRRHRVRQFFSIDRLLSTMTRRFSELRVEDPNEQLGNEQLVQMALARLPANRREAVVLLSIGYSIEEISEILDISQANTRQRLSRGMRQLREIYLNLDQGGGNQ